MLTFFLTKRRQQKKIKKIKLQWGKQNDDNRNFDLIENFSLFNIAPCFHLLTNRTIDDLDLKEIFCFIDRTNSKPGQQFLYYQLIRPTNNLEDLEKFNDQVNFFYANISEREKAQLLLSDLNNYDAYYIASLLENGNLKEEKWKKIFYADTIIVISMLLLSIKFPVLLLWLMIPFAFNIFLFFKFKTIAGRFSKSFPELNGMINVCKKMFNLNIPYQNNVAKQSVKNLLSFQNRFKILNFNSDTKDEITQSILFLIDILKAFLLLEIHSLFSCLKVLKNKRQDIINLFNYIGSIDAAISTASLRGGTLKTTIPTLIKAEKKLSCVNMYHPLIDNCVPNSITVNNKSILLMGSNMSGKSTFIRMLGINTILAQTIYTCFADEFTLPVLKTFSCIRIADNLMDAKSYYFEEVTSIGNLIKESEKLIQHLFIIDEIFKGTNTIERVAAAKAILSFLNKKDNIIVVSTHDIELADLLKDEFDLYHFVEEVNNDKLVFDHLLKTGALKTRNAIKLLSVSNYPSEIINEANTLANKN